jgi:hypothetical protein
VLLWALVKPGPEQLVSLVLSLVRGSQIAKSNHSAVREFRNQRWKLGLRRVSRLYTFHDVFAFLMDQLPTCKVVTHQVCIKYGNVASGPGTFKLSWLKQQQSEHQLTWPCQIVFKPLTPCVSTPECCGYSTRECYLTCQSADELENIRNTYDMITVTRWWRQILSPPWFFPDGYIPWSAGVS